MELNQSVRLDEGTDAYGNRHQLIFEGDQMVKQTTFDASHLLEEAKAQRNESAGQRWGDMRRVATIPMAVYAQFLAIKDNRERQKAIRRYLSENQGFITFDRYLK